MVVAGASREPPAIPTHIHLPDGLTAADLDPIFWPPSRTGTPSAWWGHVPFMHWLTASLRPSLAVELGTYTGVSFAALCEAMQRSDIPGRAYAIDTWHGDAHSGFYDEDAFTDLTAFVSARYGTFAELIRQTFTAALPLFADGSIDLLHIDGLHTYAAVREDFETWLPKLSERAVVLFHDTNVRRDDFGVWRFWGEISPRYPAFEFLHGHGLGILAVGRDVPPPAAALCDLDPTAAAALKERFAQAGARWIALEAARRADAGAKALAAENARITAELNGQAAGIAAEREIAAELRQRLAALEIEHRGLSALAAVGEQRIAQLQIEQGRLTARTEALERTLAEGEAEGRRVAELAAERERRIGELEAGLASAEATAAERSAKIAELEAEGTRRVEAAAALERRVDELEGERARFETRAAGLGLSVAELEEERERMSALSAAQFQHIAEMEDAHARDAERLRILEVRSDARPWRLTGMIDPRRWVRRSVSTVPADADHRPGAEARPVTDLPDTQAAAAFDPVRQAVQNSGLFDPAYYRLDNADVLLGGLDPLEHYLAIGWREGRRPSAEFDPARYHATCPAVAEHDIEPITYHLHEGVRSGVELPDCALPRSRREAEVRRVRNSGLFDAAFYARQNPIVEMLGVDPALHYVVSGHRAGLDPAADLSEAAFRAADPGFRDADLNLVSHLLDRDLSPRDAAWEPPRADRWVFRKHPFRLPDEIVRLALIDGTRFFGRYGFRAATGGQNALVARAAADLAAVTPRLRIATDTPDASIIVPVHGQTHFVLACLDALAAQESRFSAEILVMDDASPEAAQVDCIAAIPWLRYVRRARNGGFIETCNDGAGRARGRTIVFLNSDTRVVAGWLDALLGTFEAFPEAGLVGSKLYNADGSLQEAGGILWRDGSAWNYGRGADPDDPRYGFARQADYCSGASIGLTREAWTRAGGFDPAFAPAYCEDADLALRLRQLGFETWFQPLSRVIHYEGMTHGRSTASGVKAHQVANLKRLAARHAGELARHGKPGVRPDAEAVRARRRTMLVVDAQTPRPDRDAGSELAARIMDVFRSLGHDLIFVPQTDFLYDGRYSDALRRIGVRLAYAPYHTSLPDLLDEPSLAIERCLLFRYYVAQVAIDTLRARLPLAPIVFHNIDMHYLRERREAELLGDGAKLIAASRTMTDELSVSARVDATIVTNEAERGEIQAATGLSNVVVLPYITQVRPSDVPFEDRRGVLFLGGFRHAPNADAVRFFIAEIWPRLREDLPQDARFTVVGADPPTDLVRADEDGIDVVGYVEDLKPWLDRVRVFVAPLRYGAGVKGKVIQSLRHGLPAVVTSIAAEGVGLQAGEHVLVEDEPQRFASAVARAYHDPVVWGSLQRSGYQYITEAVSWQRAVVSCEAAFEAAATTWLARSARNRERTLKDFLSD